MLNLVYVIVPTFNSEDTLENCLQAIANIQNFKNCELIVADDASTDSTVEIAKRYKAKIVSSPSNRGVAFIRNIGAKAAGGEILLFIDSDVVLSSKDILKYLEEDFNSSDICGVIGFYDKKIIFENFFSAYKHLYMCFGQGLMQKFNPMASSAILAVPRKNFLEAGGFNEKYTRLMAEDIEFSIRLALKVNKLFLVDSKIKGLHLKEYNIKSLLKTDYLRIRGIAKIIQKEDYRKMYFKAVSYSSRMPPLFMALTVSFLILSLIRPSLLLGAFISISLFVLVQIKFLKYLKKNRNIGFALLAIFFSFAEMLFTVFCALYSQLVYKFKRESGLAQIF